MMKESTYMEVRFAKVFALIPYFFSDGLGCGGRR